MFNKLLMLMGLLATGADNSAVQQQRQSELDTIQHVNLFLINAGFHLDPFAKAASEQKLSERQLAQMEAIRKKLELARQEIESMDGNELLEMSGLCDSYRTLLGGKTADAGPLVAFLAALTRDDCDQVSLDFLMIVANFKQGTTAKGDQQSHLLVQNYAKLRVQQCWQQFVDSVPRNLERALGKMGSPLFGIIERLALKMQAEARAPRRPDGSIHIGDKAQNEQKVDFSDVSSAIDSADESRARAMLSALKDIRLNSELQRRELVKLVGKLQGEYRDSLADEDRIETLARKPAGFYDELLRQPCEQLIERVRSTVAPGEIFKSHIGRTLGQTLAEEKERNLRLDYHLQVYRICKLLDQHRAAIERLL